MNPFKYSPVYSTGDPKHVTITFTAKDNANHYVSKKTTIKVTNYESCKLGK